MPPRTFEFVDTADWCRPADDPSASADGLRTWRPLFPSWTQPAPRVAWRAPDDVDPAALLAVTSASLAVSLTQPVTASGSLVANLGPALVKDSSLLVLVRDGLALTEGYGDSRWRDYVLGRWSQAHHQHQSLVGVDGPGWRMPVKAYDLDPAQVVQYDGPCLYLSARDDDRNIWHWVLETLPRLYCLEVVPSLRNLPLLMRQTPSPLQSWFLDLLGIPRRLVVTEGRSVRVSQLVFPSIPSAPALHRPMLDWLRGRILSALPPVPPGRRRLYISRADSANGRRVTNEPQIEALLHPLGFETLVMSRLSPDAQIQAFRQAEAIVIPHGAAGTHLMFAPEDCPVIELYSPLQANTALLALATTTGKRYGYVFGDTTADGTSFAVNPGRLASVLAQAGIAP